MVRSCKHTPRASATCAAPVICTINPSLRCERKTTWCLAKFSWPGQATGWKALSVSRFMVFRELAAPHRGMRYLRHLPNSNRDGNFGEEAECLGVTGSMRCTYHLTTNDLPLSR